MNRYFKILFIVLLSLLSVSTYAQKRSKKKPPSAKAKGITGNSFKDAFTRKSKKGPNIKTSRKPLFKSKRKMYAHSTSKKMKNKKFKQSSFSASKRRYKHIKKSSGDSFASSPKKNKGGAKSGSRGKGTFKGRKK